MGKVHLLEDSLINKIAAGEVVERPSSVVKELVENAMDAGATAIDIELTEGGRKKIIVADNGSGMDADDCLLAVRRHATSKIALAEDLASLASLGFRGEALAAIASVSKFSLVSRIKGSKAGYRVIIEGGSEPKGTEWNAQGAYEHGTVVTIEDLFFNVPVRSKFLKSPPTEYAHILEMLQALALARPDISLSLTHNGKETLRLQSVTTAVQGEDVQWLGESVLRKRTCDVLGLKGVGELIYVKDENPFARAEALISPPGVEKITPKSMVTIVNGRWVKDRAVRYGILRGYQSHLMSGRYPTAVVHLGVDPSMVDVNVHPGKTEVRFQYLAEIESLLTGMIRGALRQGAWAASPIARSAAEVPTGYLPTSPALFDRSSRRIAMPESVSAGSRLVFPLRDDSHAASSETTVPEPVKSGSPATVAPSPKISWEALRFIGTFGRCYLLFEESREKSGALREHGDEALLVVDQHAFHERILFERLMADASQRRASAALMIPERIDVDPATAAALGARREVLRDFGFDISQAGDNQIEVRAVPQLLRRSKLSDLLADLVRDADPHMSEVAESSESTEQHILATMACHGAVRAGDVLTEDDLQRLLTEAGKVDFFHNCPHGRRVLRWFAKSAVGHWFDR